MIEPEAFTAEWLRNLLHEARTPKIWGHPENLEEAAELIQSVLAARQLMEDVKIQLHVRRIERASKAIKELRLVLPNIIQNWRVIATTPHPLGDEHTSYAMYDMYGKVAEAEALYASLADISEGIDLEAKLSSWHTTAAYLLVAYRLFVGSGSPSKHGPAARFVQLALIAAGDKILHSLTAIEGALKAHPLTLDSRVTTQGDQKN